MEFVTANDQMEKKQKLRGKSAENANAMGVDEEPSGNSKSSDTLIIAKGVVESLRMARLAPNVIYLTFIFPTNSVSDALASEGAA